MDISRRILSDLITYTKYARYIEKDKRREDWTEIVTRNMQMHMRKFPKFKLEIAEAYQFVYEKKILPSMRGMQFGGKSIEINPCRQYNCAFTHMDTPEAFSELMFLLLSGCGVGYSVQTHHVGKLPEIVHPKKTRRFLIADSIEGWAESVKVLISSYMGERKALPVFDFSDVRPKGERMKTSGGIAPGPEPLKTCLHYVQTVFNRHKDGEKLTTLEVHDINCYLADAVRSGGIRRSAMAALFSFRDELMRTCKFKNWYEHNPQRARANNSAVILRHKIKEEEFFSFWELIKESRSGEPGIFWTNDQEIGANPCVEISLKSCQFCNVVTINYSTIKDQADFNVRVKAVTLISTLQASYTDFHFLRDKWKETTEKDALIGVSMTGIACDKDLNMKEAAKIVIAENKRVAELIGINPSSRCTTIKPEGTSSLLLGASSGIHAWHSPYYIRRLRVGKNEAITRYIEKKHPKLIEDDVFDINDKVVSIPIKAPDNAIFRAETALQLLSRVSKVFRDWIKPGHIKGHNYNNISCTVSIKENEWERVGKWMWENRNNYAALAILPYDGHIYKQAPFEEITEAEYNEMIKDVKKINLTKVIEEEDNTDLRESIACGGGVCEV